MNLEDKKIPHFQHIVSAVVGAILALFIVGVIVVGFQEKLAGFFAESMAEQLGQGGLSEEATEGFRNAVTQENQVLEVVEQSMSSVVSIVATKEVPVLERYYEESPGFFNFPVPRYRERGTEEQRIGGGSGFFAGDENLIVTNRHVVEDTEASYTVVTADGEKHEAEVVARDPVLDIAVLSIEQEEYPGLSFADSTSLQLGQSVIAIGNALGQFEGSVSLGIISGLSRSVTTGGIYGQPERLDEVIQTDAAINPGNSGGPLLDLSGNVVGMNVAMAQGSENIGFALPANEIASIVESVERTGTITRPFLGVRYVSITDDIVERFDLTVEKGVLLIGGAREGLAVIPGSAADKAGLREGDVITSIDGVQVGEERSFASLIRSKQVGEVIELKIVRDGKEMTVQATLDEAS